MPSNCKHNSSCRTLVRVLTLAVLAGWACVLLPRSAMAQGGSTTGPFVSERPPGTTTHKGPPVAVYAGASANPSRATRPIP
jgi:hypothetical protein